MALKALANIMEMADTAMTALDTINAFLLKDAMVTLKVAMESRAKCGV